MTKEEQLEAWCNQRIEKHQNKAPINDKIIVDGCKQVKTMIETKGWDKLKEFVKEQYFKMKDSTMCGPKYLSNFYKQVSDKIWSIEKNEK